MSIVQPINAEIQSKTFRTQLGGVPDVSRPPELAGLEPDGMLGIIADLYAPLGQETSRWMGSDEFSVIAARCGASDYCYGQADDEGMAIAVPFGPTTAMVYLQTDETHPQLGNGLLVMLQVPLFGDVYSIANECAGLNFIESLWTDCPQFGCWHPHPCGEDKEVAAFSTFIPNALYQLGLANQTAIWMVQRAQQVRQGRWPDVPDKPVREILEASAVGTKH